MMLPAEQVDNLGAPPEAAPRPTRKQPSMLPEDRAMLQAAHAKQLSICARREEDYTDRLHDWEPKDELERLPTPKSDLMSIRGMMLIIAIIGLLIYHAQLLARAWVESIPYPLNHHQHSVSVLYDGTFMKEVPQVTAS